MDKIEKLERAEEFKADKRMLIHTLSGYVQDDDHKKNWNPNFLGCIMESVHAKTNKFKIVRSKKIKKEEKNETNL